MEQSLGSQLKFSACSAHQPPCHVQSTVARLCSMQGRFCRAVLEQSAQILNRQRFATPLSHAVDRGSPVLHAREIFGAVLGQSAQILSWQRSASSLSHAGDGSSHVLHVREISWNLLRRTSLPIYSVVMFWQGEYTHNLLFGKACFGEFLRSSPWAVSSNSQPAVLTTLLSHAVDCGSPVLHAREIMRRG